MRRFVQVGAVVAVAALGITGRAAAQPSASERPLVVQFNAGVSMGNNTSGTYGVEGAYRLNSQFSIFAELGQAMNVAPKFIQERADTVAAVLGGSAEAKDKLTYFDIGAKYALRPIFTHYDPYVGLDLGVGHVSKTTTFNVNGSDISEDQLLNDYGVQLGSDLAGTTNKFNFGFVLGATRSIGERYGVDVSYRYNHLFPKTSVIDGDEGINVNRLQAGFFVRF